MIQLKRCWDKLKRTRKAELAAERRYIMTTGGGPPDVEKKSHSNVDVAVPHLSYEVQNSFDNDGIFLNPPIIHNIADKLENSVIYNLAEQSTSNDIQNQPIYTMLQNVATLSALPASPITSSVVAPRTPKCSKLLASTSAGKQMSVDSLMAMRMTNAEADNAQGQELHKIRKKIEVQNLRAARLRAKTAKLQFEVAEIELNTAKWKNDRERNIK